MTTPDDVRHLAEQLAAQGFTATDTEDQWAFLVDPGWTPANPDDGVPVTAIVGGWLASADGTLSRFHPNPEYEPSAPGSPTDPVDATLHLVARGDMDSGGLFSIIKESVFSLALDEEQMPIIAPSPDDIPSLLVTTAPLHQDRVRTEHWRDVTATELADLLLERGVDVLLNPGGPASMRLVGNVFARYIVAE